MALEREGERERERREGGKEGLGWERGGGNKEERIEVKDKLKEKNMKRRKKEE